MAQFLYIGSYGPEYGASGDGVVVLRRDQNTGLLSAPLRSYLSNSPSYLALHPSGRTLYATHEIALGRMTALRTSASGDLTLINSVPAGGPGPCHVVVHRDGRHLLAAGYHDGTISVFGLGADGELTGLSQLLIPPPIERGRQAHPHTCVVTGNQVVIADLGLDALLSYRFEHGAADAAGVAISALTSGSGPRKLALHPAGHAYSADELSSTVTRLSYRPDTRRFVPTDSVPSTSAAGSDPNYPAELRISADGRRLYVSNRGRDTITVLDIAGAGLRLVAEVSAGGAWPQDLLLVGEMLYVANQKSDGVAAFRLDPRTGIPRHVQTVEVRSPSCIIT